jgi:SdrD B-like domain
MKKFYINSCSFILALFIAMGVLTGVNQLNAQITGKVYRDYNASSTQTNSNPSEPGERGITVTAYKPDGSNVVTTTDASGNYSFSAVQIPSGTKVRIEFTGLLTNTFYGTFGNGNGTSVQFVTAPATSVNLGVLDAIEYCQSNPDLFTPCYVSGNPLIAGTSGPMDAMVKWGYSYTGTTPSPSHIATAAEVGSVWGMAYQRESKKLFSATILKRHVGLGSLGLGGIYMTDLNTNTVTPYIDLATLGVTLASTTQLTQLSARGLPSTATSSSTDANVLGMVGKVGLGGMAIDPDGGRLWVMNLYEKKLVSIAIGNPAAPGASITAANVTQFAVPNPGCTNGEYRPWAVTYYRGKIYVGVICDAGTVSGVQANLFAHVYEFNPATNTFNTTPIFSTTLNYPKGKVHTGDPALGSKWEPWRDTWADIHIGSSSTAGVRAARVQPILSAIEFDTDGSLVLGLMDRGGHQLGFKQQSVPNNGSFYNGYIGGDILRAQFNVGAGTYTLESNGTSGTKVGCGAGTAQGPGNGEFFCGDNYPTSGSIIHEETFQGALAIVPGTGELTAMSMDPLAIWSGGPNYMSMNNGANIRRYNIYTTVNSSGAQIGQTQGKANGLGMIAVGCNPAPIEIGNFVWEDLDGDGIQDPTEIPLTGVTIELLKNNVVISTAVSDVSGRYIFSNQTGTSTASFKYGITQLQPNMAYQLRIPNVMGGSKQSALGNRAITLTTNDPSANGNTRDSDGALSGNNAIASITTGVSGNNDHRIDFGFKPACLLTSAGVTVVCDNNGTNNTSADDRFTLTLNPTGSVLGTGYNVTGGVTSGPLTYGSAQAVGGFFNISGGALTITITDASDANCQLANVVVVPPNTCSVPPPCLADAPDCGSDPGSAAATVEMDNLYFVGGAVASGTEIQHTIGGVDVRYNMTASDGTFSIVSTFQTPTFINNYPTASGVGDGVYALVIGNNSGTTSTINKKFSKPISSLLFSVYDIDQNDVVTITGYLKGALVTSPTLTRPGAIPTFTVSGNVATGTGASAVTGNVNGTMNVNFGAQTLDSVRISVTGTTVLYEIATADFTFTSQNAPTSGCGTALSRVDWNAAGVAYTAGSLSQTYTVTAGGETTDFRFTTTGNTTHLSAGSPAEATGVSTGGFFETGQPSLQILADPAVASSVITTSIKLSQARSGVRFSIGDIDDKANNRDQVKVQGFFHGALVKPTFRSDATEATFSINNMTATAVPWISDAAVTGTNFATLNVYFPGAVDSIAIMFTELSGVANPAQRELRISDILFCSECAFRAPENALNVTTNGGTTGGGFTTQYALTTPDGTILDIQSSPSFTGTFNPGGFSIYPVNYSGTITNFAVGANINGVLGDCLDASKLMGCNIEVCLPLCDQLVSVTTANACEGATQNAVITHLAAPGQLALYYSTNTNLTAAQIYDTPNHSNNGIIAVNTNITPTGTSTTVPMNLPPGNNYTLYAVFAAGNANYIPPYCIAMVKTPTPFTIFERPIASAGLDQTIAVPQNAILTANGGGTYLWSTNAITQSISVSPTASLNTYTVTVTQNGCTSTDEVQVIVLPPVANAGEDVTICLGETAALLARGGGTYIWSGGAGNMADAMVSPSVTTTYTVTVTVGAQSSTDEVVVTVVTDLPMAGVTPPQTVPNGTLVSLTATAGPYFAWQPNYPDSTSIVMVTPPDNTTTTYSVEVWKNGCKAITSTSVTTQPPCDISSITAIPGACVPASNGYTLAGSVTFTNPPTTGTLTVQITGGGSQVFNAPFTSPQNYSITGQTSDGASHTVTATFSANTPCNNTVNYTAPAACNCITPPTANFVPIPALCVNLTPQNNGRIVLTAFSNADRFGVSTGNIYSGPAYSGASAITGINQNLQTGIPNIGGGTYTVRLFNGNNTCFIDYVITVPPGFPCQSDPMGYLYCEETGQIIPGGTITVTPPPGGTYVITQNGTTGVYQFFTDAFVSGVYSISYTPPAGYMLSASRLPGPTLDPTGQPNPYILGSTSTNGTFLDNFTAASNPYYMSFDFGPGDPEVFNNNIPLKGCCIPPVLTVTNGMVCAGSSVDLATLVNSAGGGTLSYYTTLANANAGTSALPSSTVTLASAKNYYVRSQTAGAVNCFTVKEVTVILKAPVCGVITVTGPN